MLCPRCGQQNPDNATKCSKCYTQLTHNPTQQQQTQKPQQPSQQLTKQPVKKQEQPGKPPQQQPQPKLQQQKTQNTVQAKYTDQQKAQAAELKTIIQESIEELQNNQQPQMEPHQQPQQTQQIPTPPPPIHMVPLPAQPLLNTPPQQQIIKPTSGICAVCNQTTLVFFDNGLGKCLYCGRTFDWLNPQRSTFAEEKKRAFMEENPFIASEDEKLTDDERKSEVAAEDLVYHDSNRSVISGQVKSKEKKDNVSVPELTDEKRLQLLEDRFLTGEVSEETYKKLREKYTNKLLQALEDKLVAGEISEKKYKELKRELE